MTVQASIPDYAAARRAMVENQLRPQGVTDRAVLDAMGAVAREQFVPEDVRPLAYVDRSLALGGGRYLPAPAVLGQLLTQMAPAPGERALVVGGGCGYSAAVLDHVGCEAIALESAPDLAALARGNGIRVIEAPLETGHKADAPYDLMLIEGAVEYVPDALVDQLADSGRLGAALLDRGVSRLVVGRKVAGRIGYLSVGDAGVAALPGFSRPRGFTF